MVTRYHLNTVWVMTMTAKHPYPSHVVEAVAENMLVTRYQSSYHAVPEFIRKANRDLAETCLQALWEASRVVDIDHLPDDAVYLNDLGGIGFVGADRDTCMVDRMEHILYWGGNND